MKRAVSLALASVAIAAGCHSPTDETDHRPTLATSSKIEASLLGILETILPTEKVVAVVEVNSALTTTTAVAQRARLLGADARALTRLPFVGVRATAPVIGLLAALPGVVRVSPNAPLRYMTRTPVAPALHAAAMLDESIPTIKADQARVQFGVTGRGIGIAILDSGIDGLYQTDLAYPTRTVQNVKVLVNGEDLLCIAGLLCPPAVYIENLPISETSVGHGTHVAGIAGGDGTLSNGLHTGVAPGSDLVGIGAGDVLFVFWILAGFDYILENQERYNIKVVNNSWGGSGAFDPADPINVATKRLTDRGVSVVFAAGNEGPGENTLNPYSVAPWVIGVAALCSETDAAARAEMCAGGWLADFSSRGIPGDDLYHPTVSAPGVRVISARASTGAVLTGLDAPDDLTSTCGMRTDLMPYYTCASGTSMAAPHVAGVIALMQERAGGTLTPAQVKSILMSTADPLPGLQTYQVGAGLVNALAAVQAAR